MTLGEVVGLVEDCVGIEECGTVVGTVRAVESGGCGESWADVVELAMSDGADYVEVGYWQLGTERLYLVHEGWCLAVAPRAGQSHGLVFL